MIQNTIASLSLINVHNIICGLFAAEYNYFNYYLSVNIIDRYNIYKAIDNKIYYLSINLTIYVLIKEDS